LKHFDGTKPLVQEEEFRWQGNFGLCHDGKDGIGRIGNSTIQRTTVPVR
jgi:hypothetical protein